MTSMKAVTRNREEALEALYSVAVRIASLRLNHHANQWYIARALEELEIFTLEVQRHGSSGGERS